MASKREAWLSLLPADPRPALLSSEEPFARFVDGKWPPTWYDASAVLEALVPYPVVWKGKTASAEDKQSTGEIVQALASTFAGDGMVTPRSCYKGFEEYSFGQKKRPSAWATARVCGLLRAFSVVTDGRGKEGASRKLGRTRRPAT